MALIPQTFIDDLLDRVDIVDVINSRVQLKKAGKNYKACCPFHEEKTPSFTVAQDKQFYHCFGCSAGGNALGFVMAFDRLDFVPAIELLAKSVGLDVPREEGKKTSPEAQKRKDNLYSMIEAADRYYRQQLPTATEAISYLKSRGLTGKIAQAFGVGYAPQGWDNLIKALGDNEEKIRLLDQSGMLVVKPEEQKQYDRFRHRIMFPIRDQRGRTIGFGGRVLDDSTPKYLNSPETPIFHKGRELYGLYEARQALKEIPYLLMVEGYMDVIALAQFGIHNAVATLGTSLTDNHLKKLFRYTSEIVFCFDGDSAGRRAAARSLEISLPEMRDGVSAKFLFLPDGEDPDTMIRNLGTEAFQKQIDSASPLSEFLFEHFSEGIDLSTGEGKAKLSKILAPQINRIPQGVFKQLMLEELSQHTGIKVEDLKSYVQTHMPIQQRAVSDSDNTVSDTQHVDAYGAQPEPYYASVEKDYSGDQPTRRSKIRLTPINQLTALLINHPELADHVDNTELLEVSPDADTSLFLRLLKVVRDNPSYKPSHIFAYWLGAHGNENETKRLQQLAAGELFHPPTGIGRDDNREFCDALAHVTERAFYALPPYKRASHLLSKQTLNEGEIKQLHKIHFELPNDSESLALKDQIKQRLVV